MCDGTADCADGTDEVGCEERAEDTTEAEDVFGFEETTTETAASLAVMEKSPSLVILHVYIELMLVMLQCPGKNISVTILCCKVKRRLEVFVNCRH